jgi:hypothetical protein
MIIFAGPTISAREAPGFEVRPPAAQGDIYLAARSHPAAIGLIDGYFDERPAVWHKEILWALAEGIPVYGAASMGALRAAELHVFGMRGVGRIFEAYRDGRLTADDAVALVHGPPESGYVAMSEPLVNIEVTLARASHDGIVTIAEADGLFAAAQRLHYRDRSWYRLLGDDRAAGLESGRCAALAAWVATHRVDQKRLDALKMLEAMRLPTPVDAAPFRFEYTELWQEVVDRAGPLAGLLPWEREALLDEVRLTPHAETLRWRAMARRLLRRPDASVTPHGKAVVELRQKLQLFRRQDLERWLEDNGVSETEFGRLASEEAHLAGARDAHWLDGMVDELRLAGLLAPLLDRARRKQLALAERGAEDGETDTPGGLATLLGWHCARHGLPVPADAEAYRATLGFTDRTSFRRALARERLYCALSPAADSLRVGGPAHGTAING